MSKKQTRVSYDKGVTMVKPSRGQLSYAKAKNAILYRVLIENINGVEHITILDKQEVRLKRQDNKVVNVLQDDCICNDEFYGRDCFFKLGLGKNRNKTLEQQREQLYIESQHENEINEMNCIKNNIHSKTEQLSLCDLRKVNEFINNL